MDVRVWVACLATLVAGGCAGGSIGPSPRAAGVSPNLVMPAAALRGPASSGIDWPPGPGHWEYSRNDAALATAPISPIRQSVWAQVRTRDRLSTVNGRPREFSTTWIRTGTLRILR